MQRELLSLYGHLRVEDLTAGRTASGCVEPRMVAALNKELALLGYTLDGKVIAALKDLSPAAFLAFRTETIALAQEISGAGAVHRTLFNRFPYETPDQDEHLMRRVIGFLQNEYRVNIETALPLSCGHLIDTELFDAADFGACPICQFQVDELESTDEVDVAFRRLTPLKRLSLADDAFLTRAASTLIARPSSLSADERALLAAMPRRLQPAIPDAVTRENLPFVYLFHGPDAVLPLLSGATDVLRIALLISDIKGDLSLKEPARFRLSTAHKKSLMRLLESRPSLLEDMLRHRERWLRLGEQMRPGSRSNRRRFPKTAAAFDALRRNPKSIPTFNRAVEAGIRARRLDAGLIDTLASRPGEFLRKLDFLLRTAGGTGSAAVAVLAALDAVVREAPIKLLFEISKYLKHRGAGGSMAGWRAFAPKGAVNKLQVVPDRRAAIPPRRLAEARRTIDAEIARRLSALPAMGRVYLDPALRNIVMPYNRRGDSSCSSAVIKGSRYPMGEADVIRLFVHWVGDFDVDLSMVGYGDSLDMLMHISFTNLHAYGCVHSGDIQNAPNGASEFIDFDVDALLAKGVRYVVGSVISYRGQTFDTFPCFAGFMERDALKSGRKYEPQSVRLKFDLDAKSTAHMPVIFDLAARHVVFADIACGNGYFGRAERDLEKNVALLRGAIDMTAAKPTAWDVLHAHVKARGRLATSPARTRTCFMADELDIDAVMRLMADDHPESRR